MRVALALAVVAVAFAGAVFLHQRDVVVKTRYCAVEAVGGGCETWRTISGGMQHPSWEDPAAVGVAIGALAVAVLVSGLPFAGRRSH